MGGYVILSIEYTNHAYGGTNGYYNNNSKAMKTTNIIIYTVHMFFNV